MKSALADAITMPLTASSSRSGRIVASNSAMLASPNVLGWCGGWVLTVMVAMPASTASERCVVMGRVVLALRPVR
jgi:hypothetical protein